MSGYLKSISAIALSALGMAFIYGATDAAAGVANAEQKCAVRVSQVLAKQYRVAAKCAQTNDAEPLSIPRENCIAARRMLERCADRLAHVASNFGSFSQCNATTQATVNGGLTTCQDLKQTAFDDYDTYTGNAP